MQITASGIGSGLDIESLVSQLVQAERQATDLALANQEFQLQSELSAYGSLQSALSTLQSSLTGAKQLTTYEERSVSVSSTDVLSVTASNSAPLGSFVIKPTALAESHSLASTAFTDTTDVVGEGTLTIRTGTTDYNAGTDTYNAFTANENGATVDVVIDSSNNTLAGVRDAINAADAGVTASIVNDGSGYRLLFTSTQTGLENSLEISASDNDGNDTDAAGLSRFTFNASAHHLEQTVAAADANVTINGLAVASASNKLADAVEGLSIELRQTSTEGVTITVDRDTAGVRAGIDVLVGGYRAFTTIAGQLSNFDAATQQGSILLGDATLRSATTRVREVLNERIEGLSGPFSTLSELGITTSADGSLTIDDAALNDAIENNLSDLASLFAPTAAINVDDVTFSGAATDTLEGTYDLAVTQAATRGVYEGAAVMPDFGGGGSVVIDDSNDNLVVTVNGVDAAIAITQGTYTDGDLLAQEIQSRLAGVAALKDADIDVVVSYSDVSDTLSIQSQTWGSDSTVSISGVDSGVAATLGFSEGDGTAGLNVAGTLSGVAFTGNGRVATGGSGNGAEGLVLEINGTATGPLGSVAFSRGIADRLDAVITELLSSDGIVKARTDGIETSIDDIADDRAALELRMESYEARLQSQFGALDLLVAQLQSTGAFLEQALGNLPSIQRDSS